LESLSKEFLLFQKDCKYSNLRKTVTNVVVIVIEAEEPYVVFFFGGKGSEYKRWGFQLEEYRK
jgi:hypothetical protein